MESAVERLLVLMFTTTFIIRGLPAANATQKNEYHLLDDLFNKTRYNKRVRPAARSQDPVNVTFGLVIKEIENLDDKNQLLITRAEIREYWLDPLLKWNPSEYSGVRLISVDPKTIWLPDIVLYNNAGEGFGSGMTRTKVVITHNGQVSLNVPTIIQSSCKIQVDNYPFDQQDCELKFGSWTYDASGIALSLENHSADLSDYSESVGWKLLGVPGEFHSVVYNCCPQPYHDITYNVRIERRALYYAMYLIIPCAMISVLTLLVFLLPPDCNERMTVGMAILVGLSFFFLLVAEYMPATSEAVPLVGMYYTVTMIQVSCAFFMTCWVLRFHHQNPTEGEVPKWVKIRAIIDPLLPIIRSFWVWMIELLLVCCHQSAKIESTIRKVYLLGHGARLFRFDFRKRSDVNATERKSRKQKGDIPSEENTHGPKLTVNDRAMPVVKDTQESNQSKSEKSNGHVKGDKKSANRILGDNVRHQMVLEARQEEWRKAALVLNHICIWVFLFAVIVSFMAIFLQAPL